MSFPLPCGRVVAVLRDLQPEAPLHTALRGRRRALGASARGLGGSHLHSVRLGCQL